MEIFTATIHICLVAWPVRLGCGYKLVPGGISLRRNVWQRLWIVDVLIIHIVCRLQIIKLKLSFWTSGFT